MSALPLRLPNRSEIVGRRYSMAAAVVALSAFFDSTAQQQLAATHFLGILHFNYLGTYLIQ